MTAPCPGQTVHATVPPGVNPRWEGPVTGTVQRTHRGLALRLGPRGSQPAEHVPLSALEDVRWARGPSRTDRDGDGRLDARPDLWAFDDDRDGALDREDVRTVLVVHAPRPPFALVGHERHPVHGPIRIEFDGDLASGAPRVFDLVEPVRFRVPDVGLPPALRDFVVEPDDCSPYDLATWPPGVGTVADLVGIDRLHLTGMATAHDAWQPGTRLRLLHPDVTDLDVDRMARSVLLYRGYDRTKAEWVFRAIRGHSLTRAGWFRALASVARPAAAALLRRAR